MKKTKFALVLSGGGAKGAWEAGFLRYVTEQWGHKFSVVCGSSIGAFNAAAYAAAAHDSKNLPKKIVEPWNKITFSQVAGIPFSDFLRGNICSLLDSEPLFKFFEKEFDVTNYRKNISTGVMDTVIVTTTDLNSKRPTIWVDTHSDKNYDSQTWTTKKVQLTSNHFVASGAIPVAFKPRKLDDEWHADGSVCSNTPLQPAIMSFYNDVHGTTNPTDADPRTKILVLSQPDPNDSTYLKNPNIITSAARSADAIFSNHLMQDISKANIINDFLDSMNVEFYGKYRKINMLVATPSVSLDAPAISAASDMGLFFLPPALSSSLAFMFIVQPYIQRLLKIGYNQARAMHTQLDEFFNQ